MKALTIEEIEKPEVGAGCGLFIYTTPCGTERREE